MRSLFCLCDCGSLLSILNALTNLYETWYVYRSTWTHLNDVLHKSLSSVYVQYVYPLSLLANGSVPVNGPVVRRQPGC
jgi:hypothetical protein